MSCALRFTRARITRLMDLLLITPENPEEILVLELPAGARLVSECALRRALCRFVDWREQRHAWDELKVSFHPPGPRSA